MYRHEVRSFFSCVSKKKYEELRFMLCWFSFLFWSSSDSVGFSPLSLYLMSIFPSLLLLLMLFPVFPCLVFFLSVVFSSRKVFFFVCSVSRVFFFSCHWMSCRRTKRVKERRRWILWSQQIFYLLTLHKTDDSELRLHSLCFFSVLFPQRRCTSFWISLEWIVYSSCLASSNSTCSVTLSIRSSNHPHHLLRHQTLLSHRLTDSWEKTWSPFWPIIFYEV